MAEGIDGGAEVNPALVAGIKNRNGRIIQLPPPHSAGQREMITWPGSGVAFCGRRWGKCEAAGSMVQMANGERKPIETLVPGDMVLSVNMKTYVTEPKPVAAVIDNGVKECIAVSTRQNTNICTPNHPFLQMNNTTLDPSWVMAGALQNGQRVGIAREYGGSKRLGWSEITSIVPAGMHQTYDLEIVGNHNFIADGFVVHNTHSGVQRLLRSVSERPGLYWWVGLSWKSASMKRAWRELTFWCTEAIRSSNIDPDTMINRSNFEIRLPNGAEIWLRTAERPESLAGEGIMGAVVDEFTLMPEIVWTEYLQGTLLDYQGWAMFIGVPKGENWGARLYRQVMDGQYGQKWKAWTFSTYDNPGISKALLDEVRTQTPETIFRQEYLAQIIDEAGGVFRNVRANATALLQDKAIPGHIYTMGVDFARLHDFTVYAVFDVTTNEICHMMRFNGVDYETQVARFMGLYERFKPITVTAESNSMGGPVIERINDKLAPLTPENSKEVVQPFVTNSAAKDALIRGWAVAIETGEVKLLNDEVLIGELQVYEMKQTVNGNWRYSAPGGSHDDCVMATALAWFAARQMPAPRLDEFAIVSVARQSVWRNN